MKIAVRWRAGRRKLVIYETRKEDNMANYDVIVIGAGNGGYLRSTIFPGAAALHSAGGGSNLKWRCTSSTG